MFVRIDDLDGRETWINPVHVKAVRTHLGLLGGKKGTEIWFSSNHQSQAITVGMTPTEVVTLLEAGLPAWLVIPSMDDDPPVPPAPSAPIV